MGEYGELLKVHRDNLNKYLILGKDLVQHHWSSVEPLLNSWWDAYKLWEENDTFNKALKNKRMTVRTFPGTLGVPKDATVPHPRIRDNWGEAGFKKQHAKIFPRGEINVVDTKLNKETQETVTEVRIFADGKFTPLPKEQEAEHDRVFHKTDEHNYYGARRGIDSSAFANPLNFVDREKKYEEGLHDLSASLLNPDLSIFDQIHNNDWDAHFSFLPLSKEDDQYVLFNLTRLAKELRLTLPAFDTKVRFYRASMTRVKLANEFDMAIGYTAVPVANPQPGSPAYKLRYGLTRNTTITGPQGQQTVPVTAELYAARQQAALRFKSILGIRDAKNEIVIAIRHHAGPFPVYAVRQSGQLKCYTIEDSKMVFNGKTISSVGVMSPE